MDRYLSPEEVCQIVPGMSKGALAQLRFTGKGPKYRAPTPRKILYLESEIREWVEGSVRTQTGRVAS
jgi:predicted DNA-binding transcriptional regulator AlpA